MESSLFELPEQGGIMYVNIEDITPEMVDEVAAKLGDMEPMFRKLLKLPGLCKSYRIGYELGPIELGTITEDDKGMTANVTATIRRVWLESRIRGAW